MGAVEPLIELIVVLIAAKVGAEVMARIRQPAVIGELVIGMVIGTGALGWVTLDQGGFLEVLAEIGVVILLYEVGLEIQLADMVRLGKAATLVAVIGIITPFALGYGAVTIFDIGAGGPEAAIFIGAAMTATSVGITARVFADLRRLETDEARTVIGAAVVDDVLGLVILALVAGSLGGTGSTSVVDFGLLIGRVALYLVVTVAVGRILVTPYLNFLRRLRVPGSFVIGVIAMALTLGVAADLAAGLSPIVGAFVAGLVIAQAADIERIQAELRPIAHFFVPIFFLAVGAQVDVGVMLQPEVLTGGAIITVAAVAGKLVAGFGAPAPQVDRMIVGVGMIPRGEVGLIFAALGASQLSAVITPVEVAIVVLMVILTTLVPPLVLVRLLRRNPSPESKVKP